jgi:AGZA family xanthine/uracil permease-like MFS transporter
MVIMPFTYSITTGIGIGFITYAVLSVATGQWRRVALPLYVVAGVFVFYYLMPALGLGQ